MATAAELRALALALPEAEEKSHFGNPDFRVRGKIFAGLYADGSLGTLKLTPPLQAMVMAAKPKGFTPAAGAWGRGGWTHVHLAHVEVGALKELVVEAFRLVAPKRLLAAMGGAAETKPRPSARKRVTKKSKRA